MKQLFRDEERVLIRRMFGTIRTRGDGIASLLLEHIYLSTIAPSVGQRTIGGNERLLKGTTNL